MKQSTPSSLPKKQLPTPNSSGGSSGLIISSVQTSGHHSKEKSLKRKNRKESLDGSLRSSGKQSGKKSDRHKKENLSKKHGGGGPSSSSIPDSLTSRKTTKKSKKSKKRSSTNKKTSKIDDNWLKQSQLSISSNVNHQQQQQQDQSLALALAGQPNNTEQSQKLLRSPSYLSYGKYSQLSNEMSIISPSEDDYDETEEAKSVLKSAIHQQQQEQRRESLKSVKIIQEDPKEKGPAKSKCHFNPCCTCGGRVRLITWCRALGVIEIIYSLVYFVTKMTHQKEDSRFVDYKEWQVIIDSILISTVIVSIINGIILTVAACCVIKSMAIAHAALELVILFSLMFIIALTVNGSPTKVKHGRTLLLTSYLILYPIKVYTMICSIGLWTLIRAGIQNDRAVILKAPEEPEGYQTSVH